MNDRLEYLPALIDLPPNIVKTVIHRIINVSATPATTKQLSPSDLLVALHMIPKSALSVRKVIQGTSLFHAGSHSSQL